MAAVVSVQIVVSMNSWRLGELDSSYITLLQKVSGTLTEDHSPGFNRIDVSWVEEGRLKAMWNESPNTGMGVQTFLRSRK